MVDFRLEYPSRLSSEGLMHDKVSSILKQYGIEGRLYQQIMVSISEAFCNAYLHGNKRDPNALINMSITINDSEISVDIIDEGIGGVERIYGKKPAGPSSEGGRGIDIINHYTDRVTFSETGEGGLKVSMVFERDRKEIKA